MSAIGDYVHYWQKHYDQYGINYTPQKDGSVPHVNETSDRHWGDVVTDTQNSFGDLQGVSLLAKQAQDLEDQYNNLLYNKNGEDEKSFQEASEQAMQEKLVEEFGISAGRYNPNTLSVDSTETSRRVMKAIEETKDSFNRSYLSQKLNYPFDLTNLFYFVPS